MTSGAKSVASEILKQWCQSSQMNQIELTSSFKKLVAAIKSAPTDQTIESAVLGERICQGAGIAKDSTQMVDAKAQELIKDVYMDALISCKSRDCTQQLVKIINSNQVDTIRAAYYMTRVALTETDSIKDETEIKQLAESFLQQQAEISSSETIERQKLFAVTSLIGKWLQAKPTDSSVKQIAAEVAKTIVERYVKPVSQQEVQQYQQSAMASQQVAKKIAKRSAALKALANIPGHVLKEAQGVQETIIQLVQNKQELNTVRQSACECLEQNEQAQQILKQVAFNQEEPTEVRVAAYKALMTVAYAGEQKSESAKQQVAAEILEQVVKHCEDSSNQEEDEQFVLYVVSHLDNLRTSQQPEHEAMKECIKRNKQHYMQIQLLNKKFKQQLKDLSRSSRNYKLEQEFNQLESGLVLEGDLIFESKTNKQQQQQVLPKLVRVNMSMPVMGETVNVVEVTVRQNEMDEELLGALKMIEGVKLSTGSAMSKVVDTFKQSAGKSANKQQAEADLTIKVDGCTVIYVSLDDFKTTAGRQHQRATRSTHSIVDEVIEYLKRQPVAFNRGLSFNFNERLAKSLDVDANILAGLRFESRVTGPSANDFELVAQMEPRFGFEAIVGPAKMTTKKLLQRFSTKTAVGLRLRFKKDQIVDVQLDLPMNTMELFTFESQLVERSQKVANSYSYLPDSIYGQEDIYTISPITTNYGATNNYYYNNNNNNKLVKRSLFERKSTLSKIFAGKTFQHTFEISEKVARATGLRGKLRLAASPKDMSFLVSCMAQKYEPSMSGYRFQVQKQSAGKQQQLVVAISTPNSRPDRTMQIRIVKQADSQRTLIKSDISSPSMSAQLVTELVYDGRQYSIKTEIVSKSSRQQWRHLFESGLLSQSSSGRLATSYKPYLNIESTSLRRPIQLQGVVSYQQSPKTVISYELKSPTYSSDFVQGKLILDSRTGGQQTHLRRSMRSPIELLLTKDLTLTSEIIGQVREHAVKVHNMIDWTVSRKVALQADLSASHKNLRKSSVESQVRAQLKVDEQQQVFVVERKSAADQTKEFRMSLVSKLTGGNQHEMQTECRFQIGRRPQQVAYKHKLAYQRPSKGKIDCQVQMELVASGEHQIAERMQGRIRLANERRMKAVQVELSGRNQKAAKVSVEFESLEQHTVQVAVQTDRFAHKTEIRSSRQQFSCQSRTDKDQQMVAKLMAEVSKQSPVEGKFVVEVPAKRTHLAADLKLAPGSLSSIAIQSPRIASKAEFSIGEANSRSSLLRNLRIKSNLKDLMNKEAYFVESALNADSDKDSYFRFDSPTYRTDLEIEPRLSSAKLGIFARSKRSIDHFEATDMQRESAIGQQLMDKLKLGQDKLWMVRSIVSSPMGRELLKKEAKRALFEYVDRKEQQKHSIEWSPEEERLNLAIERSANSDFQAPTRKSFEPLRMRADLNTAWSRPSSLSLDSNWMQLDMEAKPFDGQETSGRLSILSRHRRSPFKKHESEYRYKKGEGHKAWMKHEDSEEKRHEAKFEADESPKKWAKFAYEHEKHGKVDYEHKWRNHKATKRNANQEESYANKVQFRREQPNNKWAHESQFEWDEPMRMVERRQQRFRRDLGVSPMEWSIRQIVDRYSPIEYLKHTSARLSSQSLDNTKTNYKVDFDYQPEARQARLNMQLPEEMLHESSIELKPAERLYKLQSKLYNQRTQEPTYELVYSTKPLVAGLASAEQEPVFVNSQHPMLERPISSSLVANLFKQPMKLDYSDKYGRQARFDYDQSPMVSGEPSLRGLRQKRAAVYYKDDSMAFEHSSNYDFYPESFLAKIKPEHMTSTAGYELADVLYKTSTKYGPVVVRADSNQRGQEIQVESPVVNCRLVAETGRASTKLVKVEIDNKSQRVQLAKLVRQVPAIGELKIVKEAAEKIDSGRFEHQTELLVSIVDAIFKVKSSSMLNERPVVVIEGELNKEQEKCFVKINGERVRGHLAADLVSKSAELVLDVDDKRTFSHQTRIVRSGERLYSVESATSHESRPVFKLTGRLSAMLFEEPSHLFSGRRQHQSAIEGEHMSYFQAVVFEPKEYQIEGQYDCIKKEARVVFKNVEEQKVQESIVRFEEASESIHMEARLSSRYGQEYLAKARLNLSSLIESESCQSRAGFGQAKHQSCASEIIYSDKKNNTWGAKLVPGDFVQVVSPRGKQTFNWVH